MNFLLNYLKELRDRHLAHSLARHGQMITIAIRDSQTVDDAPQHPPPEQRYIHAITATWTDPSSGKAYVFARQFRSALAVHFRRGDFAKVLIDPHNYHRYLVQV